ncbi:MAG: M3 family metallopeptidase [Opitutales bacterium]
MEHPFLENHFLIRWSALTPEHVEADIEHALDDAEQAVETIAARSEQGAERLSYETTFGALDASLETLQFAWGKVGHLDAVANSPELRKAYNTMLPKVSAFFSGLPLNARLWTTLRSFGNSPAVGELSPDRRRHVSETLADFREQGADLPEDKKQRAAEIQQRLAECTQTFSENVLDATNAWEKIVADEALLSGLPRSARESAREDARRKGHDTEAQPAWRFTLQAPSLLPVLLHADNEELRREVWQALNALARRAPHDNRPLVPEILRLRHEFARLLGKRHFADLVTERRMVGSGERALGFTENLHARIAPSFRQEDKDLRAFKAAHENADPEEPLEPWETAYWAEKRRQKLYDFNEEALRPYFPIHRVLDGLFTLSQKVFRLRIEERETVCREPGAQPESGDERPEVWHPDVRFYDVFDADGTHLGSFYADWHPRESKRGGAWFNYLITGNRAPEQPRSPHLGLICGNLTPSVGGQPALLTHNEVETVFHEFGHLLHHLCGEVEVKALNGVNVAWDFVELPSQIMENWCWERESLDLFARHHETGAGIPEDLFAAMSAARNDRKASANMRQLSFAKLDLELHMNWPESGEDDLDAFVELKTADYRPEYKTRPNPNTFQFNHLFADPTGYAAGYYSYKWAEVLDADAFTRFKNEGIMNAEVGAAFRNQILARGNAEDPARLFRAFMGRDPDPEALLRRDGLA